MASLYLPKHNSVVECGATQKAAWETSGRIRRRRKALFKLSQLLKFSAHTDFSTPPAYQAAARLLLRRRREQKQKKNNVVITAHLSVILAGSAAAPRRRSTPLTRLPCRLLACWLLARLSSRANKNPGRRQFTRRRRSPYFRVLRAKCLILFLFVFFDPPPLPLPPLRLSRRADEVTDHRGERRTMINGRYFAAGCSVVLAALISPTQNNNTDIGSSCRSAGDLQQTHKASPGTGNPAADRLC